MRAAQKNRSGAGRKKFLFSRRKFCKFCDEKIAFIDYKDVQDCSRGTSPSGARSSRGRISGTCAAHQRELQQAIKRARAIALHAVHNGLRDP